MTDKFCGCDKINHIKCAVHNCQYHSQDDCCTADVVEVRNCGCARSESTEDTACATFIPE